MNWSLQIESKERNGEVDFHMETRKREHDVCTPKKPNIVLFYSLSSKE